MSNRILVIAGILSCLAALLHLATIIGGPDWYRFLGAGEEMATLAEQGSITPTLITLFIASVLFGWGIYAFSGAGIIRRLPLLRFCLVAITSVYLLRGIGGLIMAFIPQYPGVQQLGFAFMLWSSLICAGFGLVYLIGMCQVWRDLTASR